VFCEEADDALREVCLEISKRYEIEFLEIEVEKDHVHLPITSKTREDLRMVTKKFIAKQSS